MTFSTNISLLATPMVSRGFPWRLLKTASTFSIHEFQLQGVLVTTMTTERMKTITPTPRGHREETRKSIADGCSTKLSGQFVGMYK